MVEINKCLCGCNQKIIIKSHHKYVGIPKYLHGHNKTVMSKEGRQKISECSKSQIWTDARKLKLRLANLGKKQSKKTIQKRINKTKGKKRSKEFKQLISDLHKGKTLSLSTRIKMSMGKTGDKIFEGFKSQDSKIIRLSKEYKEWRTNVFKRDNWMCQKEKCNYCNNKKGVKLHPHHIKHFSKEEDLRFDVNNGISYCVDYHLKSKLHRGD